MVDRRRKKVDVNKLSQSRGSMGDVLQCPFPGDAGAELTSTELIHLLQGTAKGGA